MPSDAYGDQLQTAMTLLGRGGFAACVRGDGRARFVYAVYGARAIELSGDDPGFFAEFFAEPHESSVRLDRYSTLETATEAARHWLSGGHHNA